MMSSTLIYKEFFGPENVELPIELALMILNQADIRDMRSALLVNRLWNHLANDNSLWREKFKQRFSNRYADINNKEDVIWSEEAKKASAPKERLKDSLDAFIAEKETQFISSDVEELNAAITLKEVIFGKGKVSHLDKFSRYYQFGQVAAFHQAAQHLSLIPNADNKMEIEETENTYYSRSNYDN